jgi:hypothetical protein
MYYQKYVWQFEKNIKIPNEITRLSLCVCVRVHFLSTYLNPKRAALKRLRKHACLVLLAFLVVLMKILKKTE